MLFPLYYCKSIQTYGLFYYVSNYAMKITGQTINTNPCLANVQKVVNFKNRYAEASWFSHIIMEIAFNFLKCEDIVVVPSSTQGVENSLQKLFGTKLERIYTVEKQKNSNTKGITGGAQTDFDENSIAFHKEQVNGTKVLLVDDIAKTGKTLKGCEKMLTDEGFEVEKLVLGLGYHLIYEKNEALAKQARDNFHRDFPSTVFKEIEIADFVLNKPISASKEGNKPFNADFIFQWFELPLHELSEKTKEYLNSVQEYGN